MQVIKKLYALIILYCIYMRTVLLTCLLHVKIIDIYQIYKYNYVLLADVLHCMLLLSQLFRCSDQPIKEGSWVLTWCATCTTPPGTASRQRGGAAYRGRHAGAAPDGPRRVGPGGAAALSSAAHCAGPLATAQTPQASRGGRERGRAGSAHPAGSPPCRA